MNAPYCRCPGCGQCNGDARAKELKEKITDHNKACDQACAEMHKSRGCSHYTNRGRTCPDCPKDWKIN